MYGLCALNSENFKKAWAAGWKTQIVHLKHIRFQLKHQFVGIHAYKQTCSAAVAAAAAAHKKHVMKSVNGFLFVQNLLPIDWVFN